MIPGPQLAQQAFSGTAERLTGPALPAGPESLSESPPPPEMTDLSPTEEPAAASRITDVTTTDEAEAVARNSELKAGLARAETTLQIAEEAVAAIEYIHGAMEALAETALKEGLSEKQRADVNAAFQELKRTIDQIIVDASFEGTPILEGGDGPEGAYQILLSASGASGELPAILIPPISVTALIEEFRNATLLNVAAAGAALQGIEGAARTLSAQDDLIAFQHAALLQIFATDISPDANPSDRISPSGPPIHVGGLSRLAADIVSSKQKIPFQDQADRFRTILERVISDDPTEPPQQTPGPPISRPAVKTGHFTPEPDRAVDRLRTVEMTLGIVRASLVEMHHQAEKVFTAGQESGVFYEGADAAFQAIKGHLNKFVVAMDLRGEKILPGGHRPDVSPNVSPDGGNVIRVSTGEENGVSHATAVPSLLVEDFSPELVTAQILTAEGASEVMSVIDIALADVIDVALEDVTRVSNANETVRSPAIQINPVMLPGTAPLGPGTNATPVSEGFQPQAAVARIERFRTEEVVAGASFDQQRLDIQQAIHQAGRGANHTQLDALRLEAQTEQARDATQRLPGIMPLNRDADTRVEIGVPLAKSMFEAPSDQAASAGGSLPGDHGGYLAELRRADNMLHVADLSIEQIELHLDYMRDLAEEASTNSSRHRVALDPVFQFVKSNIVDTLAQNTEAQGDKILSGGDGPVGEYVIRLSETGVAGQGHEIGIPSMRVQALSPDLFRAHIRTPEGAAEAFDSLTLVSEDVAQTHEKIAEQRGFIRKLIYVEIAHQGSRL